MKIVINCCYGGFGLSHEAVMLYAKLCGFKLYPFVEKRDAKNNLILHKFEPYNPTVHKELIFSPHYSKEPLNKNGTYNEETYFFPHDIERNDSNLIKVVEHLKKEANSTYSELEIRDIPDDVQWEIDDYDGMETIHEVHRSW